MRKSRTYIAGILVCAMGLSFTAPSAVASNIEVSNSQHISYNSYSYHQTVNSMERLFTLIENIPDEILNKGDEAVRSYLIENGIVRVQNGNYLLYDNGYNSSDGVSLRSANIDPWKIAACSASIAWVVGSTLFTVAKITKIKSLIKALGGIKEAAKLFAGAQTREEILSQVGAGLMGAAADLLEIVEIKNNCF